MSRSRMQFATSLVVAAGMGVMANAPTSDTIRPGYWSTTNTVSSPIHKTKTENRCVTPQAIAKFTGCYINHHYKCTCPEETSANGRILFRGDCVDAKGSHVLIDGEGVYTPTTLQLTAHGRARVLGISVAFSTATDSHWLADACPPGAPGSDGR